MHDIKAGAEKTRGLFASATRDDKNGVVIVKVVNAAATPTEVEINLAGAGELSGAGEAVVLTSDSPRDENTIEEPTKVSPKTTKLTVSGPKFTRTFPGNSLTVLRIGMSNVNR